MFYRVHESERNITIYWYMLYQTGLLGLPRGYHARINCCSLLCAKCRYSRVSKEVLFFLCCRWVCPTTAAGHRIEHTLLKHVTKAQIFSSCETFIDNLKVSSHGDEKNGGEKEMSPHQKSGVKKSPLPAFFLSPARPCTNFKRIIATLSYFLNSYSTRFEKHFFFKHRLFREQYFLFLKHCSSENSTLNTNSRNVLFCTASPIAPPTSLNIPLTAYHTTRSRRPYSSLLACAISLETKYCLHVCIRVHIVVVLTIVSSISPRQFISTSGIQVSRTKVALRDINSWDHNGCGCFPRVGLYCAKQRQRQQK